MTELPPLPECDSFCTYADDHEYEVFTADQMRAYAEEAIKQEREACIAAIEAMRNDHCAGTRTAELKSDWCEPDDQCCEFVVAWNEAVTAIRARSSAPTLEK